MRWGVFLFFAGWNLLMTIYTWFLLPGGAALAFVACDMVLCPWRVSLGSVVCFLRMHMRI